MDKEAQEKIPASFRMELRTLLWHYGIYKTVKQDAIIDAIFIIGYRKLPEGEPPLLTCEEIDALKCTYERCGHTQHNTDAHRLAQAQRDSDIKWIRGL